MHRCKYAVNTGEDLVYVAGLFEVSWIQMWALNPTYTAPEAAAAHSDSVINVGHLYTLTTDESVFDVARKFGMSVQQVMFFNADLSSQKTKAWTQALPVSSELSRELCVVPNSCHTSE